MESFRQVRLPRVQSCCVKLSIETGAKIVALTHVVVLGGFFLLIFVLVCVDQFKRYNRTGQQSYYDFSHSFIRDEFIISLIYSNILFSALLFFGILKKDKTLCEPWMIFKITSFLVFIMNMVFMVYERVTYYHKTMELFLFLAFMSLDAYMITVVNSFYNSIQGKGSDNDQ